MYKQRCPKLCSFHFSYCRYNNVSWTATLYLMSINRLNGKGWPFKLFFRLEIMNFQQPPGAVKSYYRQILTQLDAICELAYSESEMPVNTFKKNGERPQLCDQSLPSVQKEDVLPTNLSVSIDAQELSVEFAKFKQPSTSLLNLTLNSKQTDAAMLHQVQPHPTLLRHVLSTTSWSWGRKSCLPSNFCLAQEILLWNPKQTVKSVKMSNQHRHFLLFFDGFFSLGFGGGGFWGFVFFVL